MFIKAYASGGTGSRRGTTVGGRQSGRGFRSQGAYYRATGQSALGGNARTRGRLAAITPVRGR